MLLLLLFVFCGWSLGQSTRPTSSVPSDAVDSLRTAAPGPIVRPPAEFRVGAAFSWGGESKIGFLFPRVIIVRRHGFARWRPYYGVSVGLHPLLIAGSGSGGLVVGTEWRPFDVEASLNHWRTTRISTAVDDVFRGPFAQNLITLRGGVRVGPLRLRAGGSWVLSERVPAGEERDRLMDVGVINGRRYTLELVWDGLLNE